MNPRLLISLLTAVLGTSHASATPFARYDNEATRALTAEAAICNSAQRVSVGDNPAIAVYWTGEQAIPAERVADLLQLSMAAGSTTKDHWFTDLSGSVIVFMAEPGCGTQQHVFTVFTSVKNKDGHFYQKAGSYTFITKHLIFCPEEAKIDNRAKTLTVVYSTPNGNLKVEKCFHYFENPQEICRAFDAQEEKADLGSDSYNHNKPLRMHKQGLSTKQPLCHVLGRGMREIDSIDFESLPGLLWSVELDQRGDAMLQQKEVPQGELFWLYATHRYYYAWNGWMADEAGNTLVLLEEYASGCNTYLLRIYRRSATDAKTFVHVGNVAVGSRYLDWDIAATRFDEDGLYIELGGNGYQERKAGKILYSNPQDFLYRITPGDEPQ
ncbi:MAG: hypothetical protein IKT79_03775 [Akkermansia sp.]|nr:hypothetical protein [Akkermansia sp.]